MQQDVTTVTTETVDIASLQTLGSDSCCFSSALTNRTLQNQMLEGTTRNHGTQPFSVNIKNSFNNRELSGCLVQ